MNILVTGGSGLLGRDVVRELQKRGHKVTAPSSRKMDIIREASVRKIFAEIKPEAVIHCAAWTDVEGAEDAPEICRAVNVLGTENVARQCAKRAIPLMYISTDYVFSGKGDHFQKTEEEKAPLNQYGRSKYEGELAVQAELEKYFIVRTSWIFGRGKKNFVDKILKQADAQKKNAAILVVNDQTGSPTYTRDLAALLADMIVTEKYGVYHASNEGICTWYGFAGKIMELSGKTGKLQPVSSDELSLKAERPHNSRLDKSGLAEAGFTRLSGWEDALERYLVGKKEEEK